MSPPTSATRRGEAGEASKAFMAISRTLPTMYELSADWQRALDLFEDPETDPAEIEAELDRLAGDIKHKAHGVAVVIQAFENLAEMQKGEANRMAAKAKANQAHADRLRDYAKRCMQAIGVDRIETGPYTLAIRQNPPRVEITDEDAIPTGFLRHIPEKYEPNKVAIAAAWKRGEEVPGTTVVQAERLDLR